MPKGIKRYMQKLLVFTILVNTLLIYPVGFKKRESNENTIETRMNPPSPLKKKRVEVDGASLDDVISNLEKQPLTKQGDGIDMAEAYVLLFGVSNYPGSDHDLSYCDDDAYDLRTFMQNKFGIPAAQITLMIDGSATEGAIASAISNAAAHMDSNDYLIFCFSGHGSADLTYGPEISWSVSSPHPYSNYYDNYWHYSYSGADLMRVHFSHVETEYGYDYVDIGDYHHPSSYWDYFTGGAYYNVWSSWVLTDDIYVRLTSDSSITDWGFSTDKVQVGFWGAPYEIIPYDGLSSGLTGPELDAMLDGVPGRVITLLDTCHSGGVGSNINDANRYVVTACESDETSLEDSSYHNGLFTNQYLYSWNLATDDNADGAVSFEEVYPTAYSRTVSRSTSLGSAHHPVEYDGITGDLILEPNAHFISGVNFSNKSVELTYNHNGLGIGDLVCMYYDIPNQDYIKVHESVDMIPQPGSQQKIINAPGSGFVASAFSANLGARYMTNNEQDCIALHLGSDLFSDLNDADGDSLSDLEELSYGTNPWNADTDNDGLSDFIEVDLGLNPLICLSDIDCDGMPDPWEYFSGLNLFVDDSMDDLDGDGLANLYEYLGGSLPNNTDTDNDQLNDYEEYELGTDPTNQDSDGDSFSDYIELISLNDPLNSLDSPLIHIALAGMVVACAIFIFVGGKRIAKKKTLKKPRPPGPRPSEKSKPTTEQRSRPSYGYSTSRSSYSPSYRPSRSYSPASRSNSIRPGNSGSIRLPPLPYEIQRQLNQLPPREREYAKVLLLQKLKEAMVKDLQSQPAPFYSCPRCGGSMTGRICMNCGYIYSRGSY